MGIIAIQGIGRPFSSNGMAKIFVTKDIFLYFRGYKGDNAVCIIIPVKGYNIFLQGYGNEANITVYSV